MHRGRASITSTAPTNIVDARFDADCDIFATSTPHGFAVYRTNPLKLLRKRNLTGTISKILPLHSTNLIFLVGGGRNPQYPPNKVILWDEALGRVVGEIEFSEQVRGLACRRGALVVALKRRVVHFEISQNGVVKTREWDTCDNERGLVAIATAEGSTLLIMPGPPGPHAGHVRLVHLKPCPPKPPPSPPPNTLPTRETTTFAPPRDPVSIIKAHTTSLSCLAVTRTGRYLATTSSRGTLLRVWDTLNGQMLREFRRGSDQAFIYGIAFRPDEAEICVWSDKGTVHIFKIHDSEGAGNRVSAFSSLSAYLPRYVGSEWSYAEFRLPSSSKHIALSAASAGTVTQLPDPDAAEEEKAMVGWIQVQVPPTAHNPAPTTPSLSSSPSSKSSRRPSSSAVPTAAAPPPPRTEFQLVALAFSGGWYRLSTASSASTETSSRSSSFGEGASAAGRPGFLKGSPSVASSRATEKGKEKAAGSEKDAGKVRRRCTILEYKRFGDWDGW